MNVTNTACLSEQKLSMWGDNSPWAVNKALTGLCSELSFQR